MGQEDSVVFRMQRDKTACVSARQTWLAASAVNGIVVAAAKLAGDAALALSPLAWRTESSPSQPSLLALHSITSCMFAYKSYHSMHSTGRDGHYQYACMCTSVTKLASVRVHDVVGSEHDVQVGSCKKCCTGPAARPPMQCLLQEPACTSYSDPVAQCALLCTVQS